MRELAAAWQELMTVLCLTGLAVIALCVVLAMAGDGLRRLRSLFGQSKVQGLLAAAAIVSCVMYGGSKGVYTRPVSFPRTDIEVAYLVDAGSYVTNDLVHVAFNSYLIPSSAPIVLAYCPDGSTNEEDIVTAYEASLADFPNPLDFAFENAISNRWYCYTTWTPGPAVHTNGVWQTIWMTDRRDNRYLIPIRTGIEADGKSIARIATYVPYDAELEYLESTGTQWINTGIDTSTISKYVTDTAMLGAGAEGSNVIPYIFIGIHASNVFYGYVGSSSPTAIPADHDRHIFEAANTGVVANDGFYIDGVKAKDRGTGTVASAPFYLFACYQPGGLKFYLRQRKYTAKIYCNGVLVRDLIPVRVGNVGEMYDRVTRTFMERHGTFTLGPDKN